VDQFTGSGRRTTIDLDARMSAAVRLLLPACEDKRD